MPEKKIKHIEMIENIIERMVKKAFQLKGWAMTLIALVGTIYEMKRLCFCKCMFSITELWFYPLIAVVLIVLIIILKIF